MGEIMPLSLVGGTKCRDGLREGQDRERKDSSGKLDVPSRKVGRIDMTGLNRQ